MLKPALTALLLLAAPAAGWAQSCPPPTLQVLRNGQPVPATGSALPASALLRLTPAPGCAAAAGYRATGAEVSLIRRGRPVLATLLVEQPQLDLRPFQSVAQPGDHLYVFIPYQNLRVVAADGTARPYVKPKPASTQIDLTTDESRGISFKWLLTQP